MASLRVQVEIKIAEAVAASVQAIAKTDAPLLEAVTHLDGCNKND